ncbi:sodium-independent sulfate anion transporter-like [Condylostylus longicornis]|uniref:sodium-independent sulfate anion transporter-like n=1 Tax=Condylostylus longicornis TaxID=2530218 RepID=UPI00244DB7F1|nr:sodium-independent sulfate anion transporter-like [Condylostylus longicornis]
MTTNSMHLFTVLIQVDAPPNEVQSASISSTNNEHLNNDDKPNIKSIIKNRRKSSNYLNENYNNNEIKTKIRKSAKNVFYILNWIGQYNCKYAISDFIAGVTLGLTIIPESIACALLANLPPQYGLYSSFMGQLIYLIFGSVNKCIIGPTSLVALVAVQFTVGKPIEFSIIITFLAGCVELLFGILRLGFIFDFISLPVIKAFTSATAILVTESQIKSILGLVYVVPGFINSIIEWTTRISESRWPDVLMGTGSIIFLMLLKQLSRIKFEKEQRNLKTFIKYVVLSRNVIVVCVAATIIYILIEESPDNEELFLLSKNVVPGFPNISLPPFSFQHNNVTYSFTDICKELNFAIFAIPLVSLLTNISVARGLTPKGSVNANRELIALGLCNIFGSSVQSMPTCGAFSRASIGQSSGLKTSIAGLYCGLIVILAINFLTPYFHYIPEGTLAAILICSILTLLDLKLPIKLWKQNKADFVTWMLSFVVCILLGVEMGLIFGVAITILQLIWYWARPKVEMQVQQTDDNNSYIRITIVNGLYFPSIDFIRHKILKSFKLYSSEVIPVVIDCNRLTGFDYTAGMGIIKLMKSNSNRIFIMYQLPVAYENLIQSLNDDVHIDNLLFCHDEISLKSSLNAKIALNHPV